MYYIFDLDGTLANISHRLHFIKRGINQLSFKPDWDAFFDACDKDEPIENTIDLLQDIYVSGCANIIILSGRSDQCKEKTIEWLKKNIGSQIFWTLFMRKKGDHRPDIEVKEEWLNEWLKHHTKKEIGGVFEDRKQVVDMWRKNGITCYQVAEGDY